MKKPCPFLKVQFVKLTGLSTKTPLYVYGPAVEVMKPLNNGTATEIFLKSGAVFDVLESPEDVAAALKKFLSA